MKIKSKPRLLQSLLLLPALLRNKLKTRLYRVSKPRASKWYRFPRDQQRGLVRKIDFVVLKLKVGTTVLCHRSGIFWNWASWDSITEELSWGASTTEGIKARPFVRITWTCQSEHGLGIVRKFGSQSWACRCTGKESILYHESSYTDTLGFQTTIQGFSPSCSTVPHT